MSRIQYGMLLGVFLASCNLPGADLTGRWRLRMKSYTWTVRLAPRPGLPNEFKGTAQRAEKDEKGGLVSMELGAALTKGRMKAWLGPGFVVCEAAFKTVGAMDGNCKGMDGSEGPFRAERLAAAPVK